MAFNDELRCHLFTGLTSVCLYIGVQIITDYFTHFILLAVFPVFLLGHLYILTTLYAVICTECIKALLCFDDVTAQVQYGRFKDVFTFGPFQCSKWSHYSF